MLRDKHLSILGAVVSFGAGGALMLRRGQQGARSGFRRRNPELTMPPTNSERLQDIVKNPSELLNRLEQNQDPLLLTQDEMIVAVVVDITSYVNLRALAEMFEAAESIEAIEQQIRDADKGRMRRACEVLSQLRQLLISGARRPKPDRD